MDKTWKLFDDLMGREPEIRNGRRLRPGTLARQTQPHKAQRRLCPRARVYTEPMSRTNG